MPHRRYGWTTLMAFGFRRSAGTARGYVNETNPDFAIGQRLSRRQYDKYVETLGKRTHLPGVGVLREAQRRLEEIGDRLKHLAAQERELTERERALAERARLIEEEEIQLNLRSRANRRARQNAGQRRYNSLLEAYVAEQRRKGDHTLNKRTAAQRPEFKQIVSDVKGKANPRNNPNIRDENRFRRMKALDKLGGSNVFREYYENLYGVPIRPAYGPANRTGRSSFTPSARFSVRRRVA
jgi:hypothetical protein